MKGKRKKWVAVFVTVVMVLGVLGGCGTKEVTTTATSQDGSFSIDLPGEWIVNEEALGNERSISYCIEDEMAIANILIQRLPNVSLEYSNTEELQDYLEEGIGEVYGKEVPVEGELSIPNMSDMIQNEFIKDYDTWDNKTYVVYMESPAAFYYVVFEANDEKYDEIIAAIKASLGTITEHTDSIYGTAEEKSDTVYWMMEATAFLKSISNVDAFRFGGGTPEYEDSKENIKVALQNIWGVSSKETADARVQEVVDGGDTAVVNQAYDQLGLGEYATKEEALAAVRRVAYQDGIVEVVEAIYDARQWMGENAFRGWDFARAMMLCEMSYVAGYYTEAEALDKMLDIAKQLQGTYASWEEFQQSIFYTIQCSAILQMDETQFQERYHKLMTGEGNPYTLDWNMTLEKTW